MHVVQAPQARLPTAKGGCGSAWVAIASTLDQIEMKSGCACVNTIFFQSLFVVIK
jgi:hypothetical protein